MIGSIVRATGCRYYVDMVNDHSQRTARLIGLIAVLMTMAAMGCESVRVSGGKPGTELEPRTRVAFDDERWPRELGRQPDSRYAAIVPDPADSRNRVLRVTFIEGEHIGTSLRIALRDLFRREPVEAVLRYRIRFDETWDVGSSGKLPGFSGTYGRAGWGGRPSDGYNGWSARGMFRTVRPSRRELPATIVGTYLYHADMLKDRPAVKTGQSISFHETRPDGGAPVPPLAHGRWHVIEQHIRLNTVKPTPGGSQSNRPTVGRADGLLRATINGTLAFEKQDIRFRHTDELRIEHVWLDFYHGGSMTAPRDMNVYIDDIEILVVRP